MYVCTYMELLRGCSTGPADACRSTAVLQRLPPLFLPRDEQAHRMHALSLRLEGLHDVLRNSGPELRTRIYTVPTFPPSSYKSSATHCCTFFRRDGAGWAQRCPLLFRLKPVFPSPPPSLDSETYKFDALGSVTKSALAWREPGYLHSTWNGSG
jgi:hypothetical protein